MSIEVGRNKVRKSKRARIEPARGSYQRDRGRGGTRVFTNRRGAYNRQYQQQPQHEEEYYEQPKREEACLLFVLHAIIH